MKTYVFDASALIAFLQKTPGAYQVNEILKQALQERVKVVMSAVIWCDVYGQFFRQHGSEQAFLAMARSFPPDPSIGRDAAGRHV